MDEENKKTEEKVEDKADAAKAEEAGVEKKPLSIVDEAKAIRDEILEAKKGLKEEREKLEKVQSEALLSGTGGGAAPKEASKEETPKEYKDRIEKEISEGKHDE